MHPLIPALFPSSARRPLPCPAVRLARGLGLLVWLCLGSLAGSAAAQGEPFLPGTDYDPAVPTPREVLGYDLGDRLCSHADTVRFVAALAQSSDRAVLVPYGESWQGRSLQYLVLGSAERVADLPAVQQGLGRLADPRGLSEAEQARWLDSLPAVAWLGFCVHGNELSCTDAALQLAYHLLAARGDEVVDRILERCVVIVDPLQNPDGRERFVHHFRDTVGRWPDVEPDAAEHDEPWPGGRVNHYLFDMNRDWFAGTQPETRARWREYRKWWPQVFVDVHTMGTNSSYYFGPPAVPHHPEITEAQHAWLTRYGQNNARWFDRMGFDYFTREQFDAFYPGYGEGWPTFHGAVGMTFEAASVRGLLVRRDDESVLKFRATVQQHFISTLGTLDTLSQSAGEALRAFVDYRRAAVARGEDGPLHGYALLPGSDPARAVALGRLLAEQGIEVRIAEGEMRCAASRPHGGGEAEARALPAGSVVVSLAQPAGRLVHTLLARDFPMEESFLAEQRERYEARKSTQFYDLTGWSLPLLWGVECVEITGGLDGALGPLPEPKAALATVPRAQVAYLVPWGSLEAPRLLAELQRAGVRVHVATKELVHTGRRYAAGTLVVKVAGNGDPLALHAALQTAAAAHAVEVVALDSSWVDEGIALGSNDVRFLEAPRVALLWDEPVQSRSAGHARWVLEQTLEQPVTIVRAARIGRADLSRFNVLVMPDGGYGDEIRGAADRLRSWVRDGGTLIAIGEATRALADEELGMLAAATEDRAAIGDEDAAADEAAAGNEKAEGGATPRDPGAAAPASELPATDGGKGGAREEDGGFDYRSAILPDSERPSRTTGALLRIDLDDEHWLAFGYAGRCTAVSTSREIFTPVKLDRGTNVGVYAARDELVASGFAFDDKLDQLARKAWLIHQPLGRGHVVAFTEDPNFRGFAVGLRLLFANAVMFGPGM